MVTDMSNHHITTTDTITDRFDPEGEIPILPVVHRTEGTLHRGDQWAAFCNQRIRKVKVITIEQAEAMPASRRCERCFGSEEV